MRRLILLIAVLSVLAPALRAEEIPVSGWSTGAGLRDGTLSLGKRGTYRSPRIRVKPSTRYRLNFRFYEDKGNGFYLDLAEYAADGRLLPRTDWKRHRDIFLRPDQSLRKKELEMEMPFDTQPECASVAVELEVISDHVDQGALLASNEPIVSVAELDPLRAFIYVIERDYPYLGIDQPATLTTDAYPDREFQGKVARIAQLMQDTTRQAAVQLEIPNPELKLKPGMFVRVQLQFKSKENATVVPRNAVVKRNGKQGVFTLDVKGGKAHFVPVETGITAGERIEILSPELRDPVVTLGNHLLTDDVSVLVPKQFLPPQPQVTK